MFSVLFWRTKKRAKFKLRRCSARINLEKNPFTVGFDKIFVIKRCKVPSKVIVFMSIPPPATVSWEEFSDSEISIMAFTVKYGLALGWAKIEKSSFEWPKTHIGRCRWSSWIFWAQSRVCTPVYPTASKVLASMYWRPIFWGRQIDSKLKFYYINRPLGVQK